jgi:hypothetical protein
MQHSICTVISHQVSLQVGEASKAKNNFGQKVKESGLKITNYHTNKALFPAEDFVQNCVNKGQTIDYSGISAGHQNGVAERSIQTVTTLARAMMFHSIIHWLAEARPDLWPWPWTKPSTYESMCPKGALEGHQ